MTKACVILGAGASHDIHGPGSYINDQSLKPPLARELFNIEGNRHYSETLKHYPQAASLISPLAHQLRISDEMGLEQMLTALATHRDPEIRQNFKQIPGYLRDLIFKCSRIYTEWPSSYLELIKVLLADFGNDTLFIVLNYDDLLERALALSFPSHFQFNSMHDYVSNSRAKVVKLHGSITWFRLFGSYGMPWTKQIVDLDIGQKPSESEIMVANRSLPTAEDTYEGKLLYPIITAPLAGKSLEQVVCPKSHLEEASAFLADCRKFLIIGTSGLDDDLMELLRHSIQLRVPGSSAPAVHYVGLSEKRENARQVLARFDKGVPVIRERTIIGDSVFSSGFRNYLASQDFQEFANWNPG